MRNFVTRVSMALVMWSTTIGTAMAETTKATDIPLSDILQTLSGKVSMNSDQAFFETEALQGKAKQIPPLLQPDSNDKTTNNQGYTYGNKGAYSEYSEVRSGKAVMVTFSASDNNQQTCLTFKQAQKALTANGCTETKRYNDIGATVMSYYRHWVSLEISNVTYSAYPIFEPWNSSETETRQIAEWEKERQLHNHIKLGAWAYDGQCVTKVEVRFAHG